MRHILSPRISHRIFAASLVASDSVAAGVGVVHGGGCAEVGHGGGGVDVGHGRGGAVAGH